MTQFALVYATGRVLASLSKRPDNIGFAFVGLPGYCENSALLPNLDQNLEGLLPKQRYRCGDDVVCGWAGALAGAQGIAVVAGERLQKNGLCEDPR